MLALDLPLKGQQSAVEPFLLNIPCLRDDRGALGVIEDVNLGFAIRRVYFIFGLDAKSERGGHAHISLVQVFVAMSGSMTVDLQSRSGAEFSVKLSSPTQALFVPPGTWRELSGFTRASVCMVIASALYNEDDYIRSKAEFDLWRSRT